MKFSGLRFLFAKSLISFFLAIISTNALAEIEVRIAPIHFTYDMIRREFNLNYHMQLTPSHLFALEELRIIIDTTIVGDPNRGGSRSFSSAAIDSFTLAEPINGNIDCGVTPIAGEGDNKMSVHCEYSRYLWSNDFRAGDIIIKGHVDISEPKKQQIVYFLGAGYSEVSFQQSFGVANGKMKCTNELRNQEEDIRTKLYIAQDCAFDGSWVLDGIYREEYPGGKGNSSSSAYRVNSVN